MLGRRRPPREGGGEVSGLLEFRRRVACLLLGLTFGLVVSRFFSAGTSTAIAIGSGLLAVLIYDPSAEGK